MRRLTAKRVANLPPNTEERLLRLVQFEQNSGCWLWCGAAVTNGYGSITFYQRSSRRSYSLRSHRVSYAVFVGPVPRGALVLHRCDTPLCINPAHLFLGSVRDNALDMVRKGRGHKLRGVAIKQARLSEAQVVEIAADTRRYDDIAADYGVSETAVRDIKSKRTWRHIDCERFRRPNGGYRPRGSKVA